MKYIETTVDFENRVRVDLQLPNVVHSEEIIKFLNEDHDRLILNRKRVILITLRLFVVRDLMCSSEYWTFRSWKGSISLYIAIENILCDLGWSEEFDDYYKTALDLLDKFGLDSIIHLIDGISKESGKICGISHYFKTNY